MPKQCSEQCRGAMLRSIATDVTHGRTDGESSNLPEKSCTSATRALACADFDWGQLMTDKDQTIATDLRERVAKHLDSIHWDGEGCGTHGTNACVHCFGPSPMGSFELAGTVVALIEPTIATLQAELARVRGEMNLERSRTLTEIRRARGAEDALIEARGQVARYEAEIARAAHITDLRAALAARPVTPDPSLRAAMPTLVDGVVWHPVTPEAPSEGTGECVRCGHPGSHHDAGECWTDGQGHQIWDDHADQCRCSWYTPAPVAPVAADDETLRARVFAAVCSVRVPVSGEARIYAAEDGTMPLYDGDEPEAELITNAVVAALRATPTPSEAPKEGGE